jgi:hypothetical protein
MDERLASRPSLFNLGVKISTSTTTGYEVVFPQAHNERSGKEEKAFYLQGIETQSSSP